MAKKVDLSIIILNFNTKDLLRDCLRSVLKSEKDSFRYETIVVDNASTDGSAALVKKEFLQIKLICSKKNLGFAAGNNSAISHISGHYVLFLNPDTIVFPNTFKEMINFMNSHSQAGAATCRVELLNGKLDEGCHRGFPTPWNAFCHFTRLERVFPKIKLFSGYSLSHLSLKTIHEIDACSGSFLFVRREIGDSLEWFDEDYFWYGEDVDFCYRIKQKGWKIFYVPKVKIIHYKGVASGMKRQTRQISTATEETRKKALASSTEVMRIFYQKHYQKKYPKFVNWLVMRGVALLELIRGVKVR